jgi:hypothetical protein
MYSAVSRERLISLFAASLPPVHIVGRWLLGSLFPMILHHAIACIWRFHLCFRNTFSKGSDIIIVVGSGAVKHPNTYHADVKSSVIH